MSVPMLVAPPRTDGASASPAPARLLPAPAEIVLVALAALPFILSIDAQWLKLDDFMMIEEFRAKPLRELVADIFVTRTTPHVRFAFLAHLVLLPFFRSWFDTRAGVNLVYVAAVASMLAGAWALARPLRGSKIAWTGAWLWSCAVLFSALAWHTFEFKTALYLPVSFALLCGLLEWTRRLCAAEAPASPRAAAGWFLLAFACFHGAELTLPAVVLLGAALASRRRAPLWLVGTAAVWPIVYWGVSKLLSGRKLGLLGEGKGGVLGPALGETVRHLTDSLRPEFSLALVLCVVACGLASWRRAWSEVAELLALPASGVATVLLNQMNSVAAGVPGYFAERHVFFARLCFAGAAVVAATALHRRAGAWGRGALAAGLVLAGASAVLLRLPEMLEYTEVRRREIAGTLLLRDELQARLAASPDAREVVVFVNDWPSTYVRGAWVDPSFLAAKWSIDSFTHLYSCPRGAPCPRVRFFPNFGFVRSRLSAAERGELCRDITLGLALVSGSTGALRDAPRHRSEEACAAWMVDLRLVDPVEPAR